MPCPRGRPVDQRLHDELEDDCYEGHFGSPEKSSNSVVINLTY